MKNNKLLIFFLLSILFRFNVAAQEGSPSPLSYGLRIGSSFSGFTNNYEVFSRLKTGFTGGLFGEYKVLPQIGISLDLNYMMEGAFHVDPLLIYAKGSVVYPGGLVYKYASDVTLHSLHIPLMINFRPISSGVSPTISLGYSFEYYVKATSRDLIMGTGITTQVPIAERTRNNVADSFQKYNMGPVVGIGIFFPGQKYNYSFDLRYKIGLREISNQDGLNIINGQYNFSVNTLAFYLTISK
jgi:hypothetical protein